jgi:hypothetical protein
MSQRGSRQEGSPTSGREAVEAPRIDFSSATWPIVRVEFIGAVTPAVFRQSVRLFVAAIDRAERDAERIDWLLHLGALKAPSITAAMRKEAAESLQGFFAKMAANTHAEACVITTPLVRGVFTAVTWLVPLPWPVEICGSEAEAYAWLRRQRADKSGQATPRLGR